MNLLIRFNDHRCAQYGRLGSIAMHTAMCGDVTASLGGGITRLKSSVAGGPLVATVIHMSVTMVSIYFYQVTQLENLWLQNKTYGGK